MSQPTNSRRGPMRSLIYRFNSYWDHPIRQWYVASRVNISGRIDVGRRELPRGATRPIAR
jgi:hypothetical protein